MASSSAAASAASAAASAASAAAMAELSLARERAAMAAEDAQSFIAQRYFFRSAQLLLPVEPADRAFTWERAYNVRHQNWLEALETMRDALRANSAGDAEEVRQTLLTQVDAEMDAEEAEEEELEDDEEWEEEAEDELVLSVQPFTGAAHQLAPPTCVPFTGTAHRLG